MIFFFLTYWNLHFFGSHWSFQCGYGFIYIYIFLVPWEKYLNKFIFNGTKHINDILKRKWKYEKKFTQNGFWKLGSLVEISQNVTILFTLHVTCSHLWLDLGIFATTRPNFNYFGHSHNYDATIKNFILLVGSSLHLFSSINKLICPISQNNHQISCILKVFYNDIGVYFNVCIKIIYIYSSYNEFQN